MHYEEKITLKNGREALIRNAAREDGKDVLDIYNITHEETDFLLSYPDEKGFDLSQEEEYLEEKAESEREVELIAIVDGKAVGIAGISAIGDKYKLKHRASFGISIVRDFWGLGIGKALSNACIKCALEAGYEQLELDVVGENEAALSLYKSLGYVEFGRNPRGFKSRITGYQELIYMMLQL
ncbi:MAG: GNAT family N-acetyltransferase [Lachnospiraceae bacterium]|nr:GNAT family N-acetyltransferase [Lachnospiraceae bacterium]